MDAALLARLQAGREERHQGRLRHVLRHAQRPRLDAQPGRLRRHDHQPAQQRLRSDLRAGRSEERDPAAGRSLPGARSTGSRYEIVPGNALGADTMLGRGFTAENPNRVHSRVQRWRAGLAARAQPERRRSRSPTPGRTPTGRASPSGRTTCRSSIGAAPTSATPRRTTTSRQNVPNPFYIGNFASLQTTDPLLYQRLLGSTTFTSTTIQRHRLLRAVPAHERPVLQRPAARRDQVPLARRRS